MTLPSKIFIPPYLAESPLFDHISKLIDFVLREDMFIFKSEGEINEIISVFFGENLTESQLESVLIYYKVYVEPFLGTPDAIEMLFKILQLDAKVIPWYKNKVPLPHYKFSLEFSTLPDSIDYKSLVALIYLVKNERSHLGSIRTEDSPDVFVWDYSYWDDDSWDSPYGTVIDGIIFNIIKRINKHYLTGTSIDLYKYIQNSRGDEFMFQTNRSLNKDLQTNFDDNIYNHPKFNFQTFEASQSSMMFETQLIGDLNEDTFDYSTSLNRISFARQIDQNYDPSTISHIDIYSSYKKDDLGQILSIKNKTSNSYYANSSKSGRIYLDKNTRLLDDPTFCFNNSYLEFPNFSFLSQFSIFVIFKNRNISTTPKKLLKIKNNAFSIEISSQSIGISKSSSTSSYSTSLGNSDWNYLYIDSNLLKINGQDINHNLNLKISDQIQIGSENLEINLSKINISDRPLSPSELSALISSNM